MDFFWRLQARGWMLEESRTPDTQGIGLIATAQSEAQAIQSAVCPGPLDTGRRSRRAKERWEGARISTFPVGSVGRLEGTSVRNLVIADHRVVAIVHRGQGDLLVVIEECVSA